LAIETEYSLIFMIIALGIELAVRQLYFLNVPSIQNYIDKGRVFEFTKPKPAYLIAEIVWLSTKVS
jgi:hypothetical protein